MSLVVAVGAGTCLGQAGGDMGKTTPCPCTWIPHGSDRGGQPLDPHGVKWKCIYENTLPSCRRIFRLKYTVEYVYLFRKRNLASAPSVLMPGACLRIKFLQIGH